jgi:hypothetical protein
MHISKIAVSSIAIAALAFGGVAQAESLRAGASLPVAKAAKVSRKNAKKGIELNQNGDSTTPIVAGVVGVVAGVGIGVAVANKSP